MEQDNLLRQLLLLSIGTTALVVDKVREVGDEWVQNGRLRPEQATALINDLVGRIGQGNSWEAQARRQIRDVLRELGLATKPKWTNCGDGLTASNAKYGIWKTVSGNRASRGTNARKCSSRPPLGL